MPDNLQEYFEPVEEPNPPETAKGVVIDIFNRCLKTEFTPDFRVRFIYDVPAAAAMIERFVEQRFKQAYPEKLIMATVDSQGQIHAVMGENIGMGPIGDEGDDHRQAREKQLANAKIINDMLSSEPMPMRPDSHGEYCTFWDNTKGRDCGNQALANSSFCEEHIGQPKGKPSQ